MPPNYENYYRTAQPTSQNVRLVRVLALILIFVVLVIGIVAFMWVFAHGFVKLTVTNPVGGPLSYSLIDATGQQVSHGSMNQPTIRIMAHRGTYQVEVTRSNASYVGTVRVGGLLSSSSTSVNLRQESSRQFVGTNPSPCAYYTGSVLISYTCGGPYSQLKIHVPANDTTPTYTTTPTIFLAGASVIGVANGSLFTSADDGNGNHTYTLYPIRPDGTVNTAAAATLPQLTGPSYYTLISYLHGYLAYDSTYRKVYYYSNLAQPPSLVNIARPQNQNLSGLTLSVYQDSIAVLYGNITDTVDSGSNATPQTSLEVYRNGEARQLVLPGSSYPSGQLCSENYYCLLSGSKLYVYDISGSKPIQRYVLPGVKAINNSGGATILTTSRGLLNFDPVHGTGYYQYTFGGYSGCGVQPSALGYVTCVGSGNQQEALLINPASTNNDNNIDKVVLDIQKLPEVSAVSPYGKYIFISPNAGQLSYQPQTNTYGYDPTKLRTVHNAINEEISKLGLNTQIYKVQFTY